MPVPPHAKKLFGQRQPVALAAVFVCRGGPCRLNALTHLSEGLRLPAKAIQHHPAKVPSLGIRGTEPDEPVQHRQRIFKLTGSEVDSAYLAPYLMMGMNRIERYHRIKVLQRCRQQPLVSRDPSQLVV